MVETREALAGVRHLTSGVPGTSWRSGRRHPLVDDRRGRQHCQSSGQPTIRGKSKLIPEVTCRPKQTTARPETFGPAIFKKFSKNAFGTGSWR
jgi:hypothetical protein